MTRKMFLLPVLLFAINSLMFAQVDERNNSTNDTWTKPNISDEMTVNPEQNKQWRMGQYEYSAKPKNAWELGIHLGHFHINGDVPSDLPSGYGVGIHLRKAINYIFSWRMEFMYSTASGLDGRASNINVLRLDNSNVDFYGMGYNSASPQASNFGPLNYTYRNFKATNVSGAFSLILNVGNLLFHKPRNKWNFYAGLGLGFVGASVKMDYFDAGGNPYNWEASGVDREAANTKDKRNAIQDILDGTYESEADNDRDVGFLSNNSNGFISYVGTMGISRKFGKRFNLSFEHQFYMQDYDKWDGHEWREADFADGGGDQSNDSDVAHYTNLRFAFNLGNFNKVTEPLYWLNPFEKTFSDLAELKQRPVLDLTDEDGDGIIDMMDQELDSPAGCPVDTRGVTLDSDGDGLADCKDQEPYSPPGYEIDSRGVAMVPSTLTEQDVVNIVDSKTEAMAEAMANDCGEWFLPMIHFDLDKYYIKPEYYGQLHHVAQVMELCPDICVVAQGHTDETNTNEYNRVLSYNRAAATVDYLVSTYGIDRERFKLMYGGEESPLINNATRDSQQYMNRRVEFKVCGDADFEMSEPEGPKAGVGAPRKSSSYSGNKNSGY